MKLTHFYRTVPNTYEIMCMRGRGCNWVLRLTPVEGVREQIGMIALEALVGSEKR